MTSYHVSLLRENVTRDFSRMHYYVVVNVEKADMAARIVLDKARTAYPEDAVNLIAVRRNEKKIHRASTPDSSFLLHSDRITI